MDSVTSTSSPDRPPLTLTDDILPAPVMGSLTFLWALDDLDFNSGVAGAETNCTGMGVVPQRKRVVID